MDLQGKVMDLSKCGGVCRGACKHYAIGIECPTEATYEPREVQKTTLAGVKEWMTITEGKGGIARRDLMEWLIVEIDRLTQLCEEQGGEIEHLKEQAGDLESQNETLQIEHDVMYARIRDANGQYSPEEVSNLIDAEIAISKAREEVAAVKEESYRILKTTAAAMEKLKQTCDSDCREYLKDQEAAEQRENVLVEALTDMFDPLQHRVACQKRLMDKCMCAVCVTERARAALVAASEVGDVR